MSHTDGTKTRQYIILPLKMKPTGEFTLDDCRELNKEYIKKCKDGSFIH